MRLIDYDAAIDRYYAEYKKQDICAGAQDRDFLKSCFDESPTVDAAPVVHGCWVYDGSGEYTDHYHCDQCGAEIDLLNAVYTEPKPNYCQNCGAKMNLPEKGSTQ